MKRMKKWMSALLALLLLASLSLPAALALETQYYEAKEEVNLRAGMGTKYAILTSVPTGHVVKVLDTTDETWWQVSYTDPYNAKYEGYINHNYLKPSTKRNNEQKKNTAVLGCYYAVISLPLHAGPGTGYAKRTTVPINNVVEVTDTTDANWFKVNFINKKGAAYKAGYLNAKYLKKAAEPYNVKSKTYLYKKASKSSKKLCVLPKGAYISVTSFYSKYWYKISYTDVDGETHVGFALKSKLKKGTVTNKPYQQVDPDAAAKALARQWLEKPRWQVTAKSVLRAKASKKGKKVATVPKNSVVAVTSTSNKKWYKVIYNDSKNKNKKYQGYLPKSALRKYVDADSGTYVTKVETQLRASDSQTGAVVAEIPQYSLIQVNDTSEKDWYRVKYTDEEDNTYKGFVYKSHAKKYEEKRAGIYYTTVQTQLRESASQTGEVILSIPAGREVKVRKTYNPDWYVVSYTNDGVTTNGYLYSKHLKQRQNGNEAYVTKVETPLRMEPSETGKDIVMLPEKQTIIVQDKTFTDWWWAKYTDANGTTHSGYVFSKHLMTQAEFQESQNNQVQAQSDEPEDAESARAEEAEDKSEAEDEEEQPEVESEDKSEEDKTEAESEEQQSEEESEDKSAEDKSEAESEDKAEEESQENPEEDKAGESREKQSEAESEDEQTEEQEAEETIRESAEESAAA